ncbi:MAG: plasmid mobilization relaxosome protein MobC [Pseudomonadota bacterium]
MKALIRDLAVQEDLTESALLRSLLETLFRTVQSPATAGIDAPLRQNRAQRLFVRIAEEDRILLGSRAADRSLAPATYAAVLLRAHLRALTPLPKAELIALKELIGELGAIGRNLNQLARAANRPGASPATASHQVGALLRVSAGLRDHVKALLLANERSWQIGHAKDKS